MSAAEAAEEQMGFADDIWHIQSEDTRDVCAFLIQHLPADGRYEIVIRRVRSREPQDSAGEVYQTRGTHEPQ